MRQVAEFGSRSYAVELDCIKHTFFGKLDGGFAFNGFGIGDNTNKERRSFDALRLLRMTRKKRRALKMTVNPYFTLILGISFWMRSFSIGAKSSCGLIASL